MPDLENFLATERNRAQLTVAWLTQGDLDNSFDDITRAITARRQSLNVIKQTELQSGDRVRFARGKPTYIIGVTGSVTDKRDGKIVVTVDAAYHSKLKRFLRPDGTIATPVSLVERI